MITVDFEASISQAQSRRDSYAFLADFFLNPIPTPGACVAECLVGALRKMADQGVEDDEDGRLRDLVGRSLAEADELGLEEWQHRLAVDRTLMCRTSRGDVSVTLPYEGLYLPGKDATDRMAEVSRAYAEAGLAVSPDSNQRQDYIGIELMFLAWLAERQVEAARAADAEELDRLASAELSFIEGHLGAWAPAYCAQVEENASTSFMKVLSLLILSLL